MFIAGIAIIVFAVYFGFWAMLRSSKKRDQAFKFDPHEYGLREREVKK